MLYARPGLKTEEAGNLARRKTYTSLSILLCLLFLIALSPASAGELRREGFRYEIEFPYSSTIVEGFVVDNNGEGIENASITGWAHSDIILIDVKTDNNGYFKIVLPGGENHEYSLNINENHYGYNESHPYRGFDNDNVKNMIKSGEHHRLRILLTYDPFDIKLVNPSTKEPENSGSLTRDYTSSSYSGRHSASSLAQRTIPVFDASGNPIYDTVEEKVLTGYTWEEEITRYRTETTSVQASGNALADSIAVGILVAQGYSVTPNYTTEQYISGYREESYQSYEITGYGQKTETYTYQLLVPAPTYRTERYISGYTTTFIKIGWISLPIVTPVYSTRQVFAGWRWEWRTFTGTRTVTDYSKPVYGWVTRTRSVPIYSTRQVISGYTATKQVPYEVWETKSAPTPPSLYKPGTLTPRDDIRNLKEVYTTTTRQVPRTRVETYTAYKIYDYGGASYSYLPWGEKQTTVTATPKNGYTGDVRLAVEADDGVSAEVDSSVLSFSSPTSTILHMTPNHASTHLITVKGCDSNGRLVHTLTYELEATESLPSSTSWESYVGTTEQPDDIPATITSTSTSTVDVEMPEPISFTPISSGGTGSIYDDGTFGGPMTRLHSYDPSRGYLYDSVTWTEGGVTFAVGREDTIPGQLRPEDLQL